MVDRVQAFLAAVDAASPEALMMSRRHCHCRNLSSIVVANSDGRLTRAFLAEPGHEMHTNGSNAARWAVGVHDHRYSLTLTGLYGVAHNYNYRVCDALDSKSLSVNHWLFRSAIPTGEAGLEPVGDAFIQRTEIEPLSPFNNRLRLPADRLHTVWCRETWKAAWLVEEGPVESEVTKLYTRGTIDLRGLYQPFTSADDVRAYTHAFFN